MKDINLLTENGVNVEKGIELLGDIDTYNEVLEDFLIEAEEKMSNIITCREQGDMENYAILVHSLKSDSKYFGFDKLADTSYQHELESKNNNIDFINSNFNELNIEFNRILNLVKTYLGK